MHLVIVIIALLIAFPAFADSGCTTLPATHARYCWNDHGSTTTWPNGQVDWERHSRRKPVRWDWGFRWPHHHAVRHHVAHPPRERVIERESFKYERVIKKEVR